MLFFVNLFERLAEDEDESSMKVAWEFYGPLYHMGLLFPRYTAGYLKWTLLMWFVYFTLIWGHFVLLGISILKEIENFALMGLLLHFNMLLSLGVFAVPLFNYERKRVIGNHRLAAREMGSYPGEHIYSEKEVMDMKKRGNMEAMRFMILPCCMGVVVGVVILLPYISKYGNKSEPYTKNGVNPNLPIPIYYPFPSHEGIWHLVVIMAQLVTALGFGVIVITLLLALIRFCQRIKFEYQTLGYALRTLFIRANELHRLEHPGSSRPMTRDPQYQKHVGLVLRSCVIHHITITEFVGVFSGAQMKWPTALGYGVTTGGIGLSLVNIIAAKREGDFEAVAVFALIGLTEVLSVFFLSLTGEIITTESKKLRDVLYDIDWYKLDIQNRKTMLTLQVGVMEPVVLKAGGLVDVCLDTFTSIMNSSYSFFNIMNSGFE